MLRRAWSQRNCAVVDAHVIHQHGLGENGGGVRISRPATSNRNIQQEEERVIVDPPRSLGQVGGDASRVEMVVDVETDRVRLPLDGEEVKIVGKALIAGCLLYTSRCV